MTYKAGPSEEPSTIGFIILIAIVVGVARGSYILFTTPQQRATESLEMQNAKLEEQIKQHNNYQRALERNAQLVMKYNQMYYGGRE